MAEIGYGAILKWATNPVGSLTRIGAVKLSATKVDSTTLNVANAYKTIQPGLIDPGDVDLEGFLDPSDTLGQVALLASFNARTIGAFEIEFPTLLSAAEWTGNAYVTSFTSGDVTPEGLVPFSCVLSISAKPTLGITASAGMTVMTGIEETAAAALVILPAVAVGTYTYAADFINTASTWVKLTVTAAGAITATVLGVEHTLITTVQSDALVIGAAAIVTPIYIKVVETGKAARNYTLYIPRP